MSRHAMPADDVVLCVHNGKRGELGITADGRVVVLELPDGSTARLTLKHYDRLKHKLIVVGNQASWADVS